MPGLMAGLFPGEVNKLDPYCNTTNFTIGPGTRSGPDRNQLDRYWTGPVSTGPVLITNSSYNHADQTQACGRALVNLVSSELG